MTMYLPSVLNSSRSTVDRSSCKWSNAPLVTVKRKLDVSKMALPDTLVTGALRSDSIRLGARNVRCRPDV